MVNEYLRQDGYSLGNLKPHLFLLPKKDTTINYTVGNNTCEVISIASSRILKMEGVSAKYEEASNENTRFNFTSTVTFQMREQWGEPWLELMGLLITGDYYVVFEDKMGVQYIQTPEFTSIMSYQYTFDNSSNSGNVLEIYFRTDANVPACILRQRLVETQTVAKNDCSYLGGRLERLRMCDQRHCYVEIETGNRYKNIYTTSGDTFKLIEPCKNNFSYRQQYSNNSFADTITFTIPLSDYKYYFHYSLEEFMGNRYAVLFETADGDNTVASGFEFGYFPGYEIQTSEEDASLNTITITLRHVGQYSMTYTSDRNAAIIEDDTVTYTPADKETDPVTGVELNGFICQGNGMAMITLVRVMSSTGKFLGTYKCLEEYEDIYKHLPLIGTFKLTDDLGFPLTQYREDCTASVRCGFTQLPNTMYFTKTGDFDSGYIQSKCDWRIVSKPDWLDIDPMEGNAGTTYVGAFECNRDAVKGKPEKGIITFVSEDNIVSVTVYLQAADEIMTKEVLSDETYCQGCNSYYYTYIYVSVDGGKTWGLYDDEKIPSDILKYENDPDCGCYKPGEPIYKGIPVNNDYICDE